MPCVTSSSLNNCIEFSQLQCREIFIQLVSAVDRMGKMVLAGGAAVGLGALCYYGLGMSSEIGAIEKAV